MHSARELLRRVALFPVLFCAAGTLEAGPYAPAAGQADSTAIDKASPSLVEWASVVIDYTPGSPAPAPQWRDTAAARGPAEGDGFSIISLGDGGSITLGFAAPIADGPGFDFAVFENSFNDTFLELAYVEVSDGGTSFIRLPNRSLTGAAVPFIGASMDPTNLDGLAGKYRAGFGTPFDLSAVGLSRATHVRLVDIPGDGSATDSAGSPIYDPYPTAESVGFDLDAVGVIHAVPEPGGILLMLAALALRGRRRKRHA